MKKTAYLLMLLFIAACEKEDEPAPTGVTSGFSPTFILGYLQTNHYYIRYYARSEVQIYIDYQGESWKCIFTPVLHAGTPSEEERQEFERLSERNGDTTYNQVVWHTPGKDECWADNFRRIEVVCTNRAVDAAHPAGTPLNDLLIASVYTCGPYVRSGYQGKEWRSIEKPLPEMKPEDMEMIARRMGLGFRFASPSGLSGSYDLQATITTTDGEEKIATGTVEFPYTHP